MIPASAGFRLMVIKAARATMAAPVAFATLPRAMRPPARPSCRFAVPPPAATATDIHAWARASLAADTGAQAEACDAQITAALVSLVAPPPTRALAELFATAPSADGYRHVWRLLARAERSGAFGHGSLVHLFALPLIVVAALAEARSGPRELPGVVADAAELSALLVEHGALAGNRTIAVGSALADANALDFARLPVLFAAAAGATTEGGVAARADVAPAPIAVTGTNESVHLRFLVGTALAAPGAAIFSTTEVGRWSLPLTQRLSAALAVPGTSVLALPRAPLPLVEALWQGRLAQREVTAQLFVSNAARDLRARVGEPSAVISVHQRRSGEAPFEVRLSLSSPFEPGAAQGLRCPLWPLDRVDDVVAMLVTLLGDCRIAAVRREPGVHPDRDPRSGGPLLFKAAGENDGPAGH